MKDIYQSGDNPAKSDSAVIVLPEIFGLNGFIKATADQFAQELKIKAFALDHFYPIIGETKVHDYANYEEPIKLMQQVKGEQFVDQFTAAVDFIQKANPEVSQIIVNGFCFGGKLAWLAGTDKRVNRVVSYYGAGPHQPDFYQGRTVIEAFCDNRKNDANLKVMAIYGSEDESVSAEDRAKSKQQIEAAGINLTEKVYTAGHAFANFERPDRYDQKAANQAWWDVLDFLKS